MKNGRWFPLVVERIQRRGLVAAALTAVALMAALVGTRDAFAQTPIGRLNIVRQVLVSSSGGGGTYSPARHGQGVSAGQGVRTLKRSRAEIAFRDGSVLRVNERTDLIVQDAPTLRNIRLNQGAVWVRVARGVATQVETPTATAVARGTVFVVSITPDGVMTLTVIEGTVALLIGGQEVVVNEGETVTATPPSAATGGGGGGGGGTTAPNGTVISAPAEFSLQDAQLAFGWANNFEAESGVTTTPGTPISFVLRSSPITETQQATEREEIIQSINPDNNVPTLDVDRFLAIAQRDAVPDIRAALQQNPNLTLAQYRQQFAAQGIQEQFGIAGDDLAYLQGFGIDTVDEFMGTLLQNSAGLNVNIGFPGRQTVYRPNALLGRPNFDYRLLDRTETSLGILAIGAAASLAADAAGRNFEFSTPELGGSVFAFAADPVSVAGGRAEFSVFVGDTRLRLESNAVRLLDSSGNQPDDWQTKLDSVAVVERTMGGGVTLFAGRKRFYHGPVFQNSVSSQLIGDRFSGAGVNVRRRDYEFEAAFIHDTNPLMDGAQEGGLGSAFVKAGGGIFGVHLLEAEEIKDGHGRSFSFSYPVVANSLDLYGEVGRGVDGATLQTYGIYLPGLFQRSDVDLFLEYGNHKGLGRATSLVVSKQVSEVFNLRGFASTGDGMKDVRAGIAVLAGFSTK